MWFSFVHFAYFITSRIILKGLKTCEIEDKKIRNEKIKSRSSLLVKSCFAYLNQLSYWIRRKKKEALVVFYSIKFILNDKKKTRQRKWLYICMGFLSLSLSLLYSYLSYFDLQTICVSFCAVKHARSLLFLQGRRSWQWDAIRRQKKRLFTLKRVHRICS
jgi:hypothetical protein